MFVTCMFSYWSGLPKIKPIILFEKLVVVNILYRYFEAVDNISNIF